MLTFTLAISCLTSFNLPWFMDLTFQVPMQYCSLHYLTLLLSPVTSTTGYCFCLVSIHSFSLELFLHWSLVVYWAPTNLGSSFFSFLSFCLFVPFMGFSRQEYWSGLPFPSPKDQFSQTSPPWSILFGWPHMTWLISIELHKTVVHVIKLASFLDCGFSLSGLWCPVSVSSVSQISHSVVSDSLRPHESQHARPPCPSPTLYLPSYLGFSDLGRGVSLQGCSSKVQLLLLTLDVGYPLTATAPDLGHGS